MGLVARLARRHAKVGVFRPIVRGGAPDELLRVLLQEAPTDLTADAGLGRDPRRPARRPRPPPSARVVDRYHAIAQGHDVVLVVGSDFTDVAAPTEFATNATIAADLGTPLVLVAPARDRDTRELAASASAAVFAARAGHAHVAGVVVNQVPEGGHDDVLLAVRGRLGAVPVWALPEAPLLRAPTVADLVAACDGILVHGDAELLDRESLGLVVAAMSMPHVIDRLFEGATVIVPGDRDDVVLGVLLAHHARTLPTPVGRGAERRVPALAAGRPADRRPRRAAADRVGPPGHDGDGVGARPGRGPDHRRVRAQDPGGRGAARPDRRRRPRRRWSARASAPREGAVTPLMFEHELIERARAAGAHIVLPEGADERILRAADQCCSRGIAELTLLGDEDEIRAKARASSASTSTAAAVVDPRDQPAGARSSRPSTPALRAHKGVTVEQAHDRSSTRPTSAR